MILFSELTPTPALFIGIGFDKAGILANSWSRKTLVAMSEIQIQFTFDLSYVWTKIYWIYPLSMISMPSQTQFQRRDDLVCDRVLVCSPDYPLTWASPTSTSGVLSWWKQLHNLLLFLLSKDVIELWQSPNEAAKELQINSTDLRFSSDI